ncbi:hypothetical protein, partial [Streptomyces capuensis]|uniref:hypothetical protein n=1 Tax=Streptomyces capuensis TaxID=1464056 RepID=UPI001F44C782
MGLLLGCRLLVRVWLGLWNVLLVRVGLGLRRVLLVRVGLGLRGGLLGVWILLLVRLLLRGVLGVGLLMRRLRLGSLLLVRSGLVGVGLP